MSTCPVCSTNVEATSEVCPKCGTALTRATPPSGDTRAPHRDIALALTAPAEPAADSSRFNIVGVTIGNQFVVEAVLGAGAFGTVYRGRQLGLDRPVAIKVPTHAIAADPVMAKRFAREATSAARIDHPGVVRIYAVGELSDGRPYLAMELVHGEPLDKILSAGPLAPLRALHIVRAIASALSETHAANVVHRDLKPTNIMWRRDRNGDDRITIVDFGIAASQPGTADATRLTAGGLLGTPHYMSPEQAHGDHVDARSDIYALGCVLFELVTGKPPFDGSGIEVLLAHLGREAPSPSASNAAIPEAIDRLCASWLAKKPEQRPATADEVVRNLDAVIAELTGDLPPARSTPTAPRRASRSRAHRRPKIATGVAAVIAIAAGAVVAWNALGPTTKPAASVGDARGSDTDHSGAMRVIDSDDGEIVIHVRVPDPIVNSKPSPIRIEIKNKLGQPIVTKALVLTIADDHGTKGLTAAPLKSPGQYQLHYTFPRNGHYVLRVFPPSIDSSFEIPLDVR